MIASSCLIAMNVLFLGWIIYLDQHFVQTQAQFQRQHICQHEQTQHLGKPHQNWQVWQKVHNIDLMWWLFSSSDQGQSNNVTCFEEANFMRWQTATSVCECQNICATLTGCTFFKWSRHITSSEYDIAWVFFTSKYLEIHKFDPLRKLYQHALDSVLALLCFSLFLLPLPVPALQILSLFTLDKSKIISIDTKFPNVSLLNTVKKT